MSAVDTVERGSQFGDTAKVLLAPATTVASRGLRFAEARSVGGGVRPETAERDGQSNQQNVERKINLAPGEAVSDGRPDGVRSRSKLRESLRRMDGRGPVSCVGLGRLRRSASRRIQALLIGTDLTGGNATGAVFPRVQAQYGPNRFSFAERPDACRFRRRRSTAARRLARRQCSSLRRSREPESEQERRDDEDSPRAGMWSVKRQSGSQALEKRTEPKTQFTRGERSCRGGSSPTSDRFRAEVAESSLELPDSNPGLSFGDAEVYDPPACPLLFGDRQCNL